MPVSFNSSNNQGSVKITKQKRTKLSSLFLNSGIASSTQQAQKIMLVITVIFFILTIFLLRKIF